MGSEERSKEKVSGVSRGMKEEKVAGLCPRDLNRRTIKEVAHTFFFSFTDGGGVSTNCYAHAQNLRDQRGNTQMVRKWGPLTNEIPTREMYDHTLWKGRGIQGHTLCVCV